MKKIIFCLACNLLRWSSLPWFMREVHARRKVTIINYHNPDPNIFEKHARFYSRHYSFVSIDQVVESLENGTFSRLPPKSLLITFDDGYANNARLISIIQRYRIPAVIYVVAGVVGTHRHFWFSKLPRYGKEKKILKSIPDSERRARMRFKYSHWDEKEYDEPMALSVKQLNAFVDSGCTIGSHSLFHPLLDLCDEQIGFQECRLSRERLEALIGKPVVHFALPNGNFNEKVLDWVRRAGYRSCRTTLRGWVTQTTSPFSLPDFGVADTADTKKAEIQVCGLWNILKNLVNRLWTFSS